MKRIFIVEDEQDFAENLELLLINSGHTVIGIEENGEQALDRILDSNPDLILMDVMLSGKIDGIELSKLLRKKSKVPIIFISAYSDPKYLERISEVVYDSFILKPFTKDVLTATINLSIFKSNKEKDDKKLLRIRDKGLLIHLKEEEIVMLIADGLYTKIYTTNRQYVIREILKSVTSKLSEKQFIRIHKSYLVNLKFITAFNAKEVYLGDHVIPIRRGYFKELGEILIGQNK